MRPVTRMLAPLPWRRYIRRLSLVTTMLMFVILVMGALVTNTGSQAGCGRSWPLCKGQFIPQFALATAIEYSHRVVVAPVTLMILALTVGVLIYWRKRLEIKILAPLMVIFLFAQALLGAAAVLWPESPEALALHFGVSLISFVSILLTCAFLYEETSWDKLRDRPLPRGFRPLVWGLAIFSYVVVYLGAYVRHTGSELACAGWPLCNGQFIPQFTAQVAIVFIHRVSALALTVGVTWLFFWSMRMRKARPDLYLGSILALVFVLAQAADGAYLVYSHFFIYSTLTHSALVALEFGALCYLALHTLRRPRAARSSTASRTASQRTHESVPTPALEQGALATQQS